MAGDDDQQHNLLCPRRAADHGDCYIELACIVSKVTPISEIRERIVLGSTGNGASGLCSCTSTTRK